NLQSIIVSNPLLDYAKLINQVHHRDVPPFAPRNDGAKPAESYLLAVYPTNGKDLWKVPRPDEAVAESKESYATPVPFDGSPRKEVVVIGGDAVTGHDAASGKELWRVGGWNPSKIGHWRIVPSVVTGDGVVFA